VAAGGDYIPLRRRALVVTAAFAVLLAVQAVAVVADVRELELYDRFVNGEPISHEEWSSNDDRQAALGTAQTITYPLAAVAFIAWLHLAYGNLDVIGARRRYGRGWAIGSWFVPFLNLVRPLRIVNDVWRGGAPPDAGFKQREPRPIVIWWWVTFVVDWVFAHFGLRAVRGDATTEELRMQTTMWLASDTFTYIPAILALVVVWSHTRRLDARGRAVADKPRTPEPGGAHAPFAEPRGDTA
jgi:hypothetical protein